VGTLGPLSAEQRTALVDGRWYVHVATAVNPDGELRGQIALEVIDGVTCPCAAAPSRRDFKRCARAGPGP
jgi:hypothetical protein